MDNLRKQADMTDSTLPRGDSKTCRKCGETKALTEFHRDATMQDGRTTQCAACRRARSLATYRERAANDELRSADNARVREYRKANRERLQQVRRRYREANAEAIAEQDRAYRAENAERIRRRRAAYSAANAEELSRKTREWQRANPDKVQDIRHRRRARVLGTTAGPIAPSELWTGSCAICGNKLDAGLKYPHLLSPSLDHIVPLARGGGHVQENLQWTHLDCNRRKAARLDYQPGLPNGGCPSAYQPQIREIPYA